MLLSSCHNRSGRVPEYPLTVKGNDVDTIFGVAVADPYRWLENDTSAKVKAWVMEQNRVTAAYLSNIPYREEVRQHLLKIWNFERYTILFREGDYTYFTRNDGLQDQFVYYRQKGSGEPEIFIDPNSFSADGTTSIGEIGFSADGSKVAYSISLGGSDWRDVIIMDAISKKIIDDTLSGIKFTSISWKGNEGFYYSAYDKPTGSKLTSRTDHHKLYFHKIGTNQSADKVVFGADRKRRYVDGQVTEDGRYLVISASMSTTGNELYIKDLTNHTGEFKTIIGNFDNEHYVLDNDGSKLYIVTDLNAPNSKIITTDAGNPGPEHWTDFIPETGHVLQPAAGAGYFFANYMVDAVSLVKQFDRNGKMIREISLPGIGSAAGFKGKKKDKEIYYSFTNYLVPSTIFKMDPVSGNGLVFKTPAVAFNSDDYRSDQVFFFSDDSTRVPMIISYRKDIVMDGRNPTILYGYGGFGASVTPSFAAAIAAWLDLGGVYAAANIRGGGEYGEKWHLAGTRMNKQNVFNDFIAAARYLIENKFTSPDFLAARGVSNGGLLVGAAMTRNPGLFKVALPAVGVMDILRYHKFTSGEGWAYDYGTADESPEMFRYLLEYSPVNNVRAGTRYPATLVTTGDHDDRVVPAHSFKFIAHLQEKQAGPDPVLIRVETNAGHGAGTPVSKTIDQFTDIYSFTLWNMNIKKPGK
jgi:prolyl oligopeptidase